jgi:hypothetical protein
VTVVAAVCAVAVALSGLASEVDMLHSQLTPLRAVCLEPPVLCWELTVLPLLLLLCLCKSLTSALC